MRASRSRREQDVCASRMLRECTTPVVLNTNLRSMLYLLHNSRDDSAGQIYQARMNGAILKERLHLSGMPKALRTPNKCNDRSPFPGNGQKT